MSHPHGSPASAWISRTFPTSFPVGQPEKLPNPQVTTSSHGFCALLLPLWNLKPSYSILWNPSANLILHSLHTPVVLAPSGPSRDALILSKPWLPEPRGEAMPSLLRCVLTMPSPSSWKLQLWISHHPTQSPAVPHCCGTFLWPLATFRNSHFFTDTLCSRWLHLNFGNFSLHMYVPGLSSSPTALLQLPCPLTKATCSHSQAHSPHLRWGPQQQHLLEAC